MAKTRPSKKQSKRKEKSVLRGTRAIQKEMMTEDPSTLYEQAIALLQTGQPEEALALVERGLSIAPPASSNTLIGLNLAGELYVQLGDIDTAREHFLRAVTLDADGVKPESQGGGAEKFLWLAQLSEEGGHDSVRWFERGVGVLRQNIQALEASNSEGVAEELQEKKQKLANALCGVIEIYMTDLSWEEDAESRCEALITEALLMAPDSPECLQTLASIRISQLRHEDARAALARSLDLWRDLPPDHPRVPDFPVRVSLSRLLMEAEMEIEALKVLERMILEDDQSIETWYLGGWCQYLLGKKGREQATGSPSEAAAEQQRATLLSSRSWLRQGLKLYDMIQYEDTRLKEHALELVQELEQELGDLIEDSGDEAEAGNEDEWEDEDEGDSAGQGRDTFPCSIMDVTPKPAGKETSPKTKVLDSVVIHSRVSSEVREAPESDNASLSDLSSLEDGSDEQWETESLYEDAVQFVSDEQLRDGVIPGAVTLEEARALRSRLREIGVAQFLAETVYHRKIPAKKLCTAFGIVPPAFLDGSPDETYLNPLCIGMRREYSKRLKLPQYNTIDDAVELLKRSKNIVVLTGAGISTSLGIPDFRSKDIGLYSKLQYLGLNDPQDVFDISLFLEDPSIFFSVAKDILPTEKRFSPTHAFIKLLQDKGKLLTNFTQNIDNLEANAGVDPSKLIQCHGSFATATCTKCHIQVSGDAIFDEVRRGLVPQCQACTDQLKVKPHQMKRKRSSNGSQRKDRKRFTDDDSDDEDYSIPQPGVMKPDITFFGEDLPDAFRDRLINHDRDIADLVIVIGTSLKVAPVSGVPGIMPQNVPHLFISRTPVSHIDFDIDMLGDCDVVVSELCQRAGWDLKHEMIPPQQKVEIQPEEGFASRYRFTASV
ncbi:hypothetical protein UREG_05367 [Uncinocarpus reesii 1704]|uniref:Deacetylase sirtuin-type domain-containing protein n=1 Tax=Uncinocarpus reesii (strain UAMH 1704) TaxID=336963 RepID=C4JSC8_UNCRE|nr:uncharacterized protein UREG_05367 [Uncinocarpus reesii 1704]EEP80525.1 hypothetical protein UREG_05367 [Uncinocarpus reesii 1704]